MKLKKIFFIILSFTAVNSTQAKLDDITMLGAASMYRDQCSSVDSQADEHARVALDKVIKSGLTTKTIFEDSNRLGSFNYGRGVAEGVFLTYSMMLKKSVSYSCNQLYLGLVSDIY